MGSKCYEVAIIGGGVCGSAIAYYLAKAGAKIVVLEKGDICSGASGTNPGFCVLTYREDPLVMELALEQRLEWKKLAQEVGVDFEYATTGGLIPFQSQEQLDVLAALVDNCHSWGLKKIKIVKPEEAIQQEKALDATKIMGAVYCPWEGRINPFKLTIGLIGKARQLGADVITDAKVTGMEVSGGEVKTIFTSRGMIKAGLVICATGAWTAEVVAQAGVKLPVLYERGRLW